jgi:putative methionine-R-sulfoxide reductase with GAF domain
MIGFGFMDNLVMICAGEYIDQTFGVALGISTMTAAGFGQCFSDVAGNMSGGLVDAACAKLNLPSHGMTEGQLDSKISRFYRLAGACVGVVSGCLLGMSCLVFIDTDAADRAKRAKELQSVFEHVVVQGTKLARAERASLFMLDKESNELWSQVATGREGIIKVGADSGIIGACIRSGELLNIPDASRDKNFNASIDKQSSFRTKSVLVIPVKNEEGDIIGAIQMINKKSEDGSDTEFTSNDETLLRMMADHVTSFIKIVG